MKQINSFFKRLITGIIFLVIFWTTFIYLPELFNILIIGILLAILFFEWTNFFKLNDIKFWVILPFYPVLPFISIIALNIYPFRTLLAICFILVFSFDTGAYIIGKLFGKHKISPQISPAKTYEGSIGGWLFSLLALTIIFLFLKKKISLFLLWFSLIIALLSFFGDLLESYLKRKAHIKDAGSLLPGHGGFLDRFDSILAATTFCYMFRDFLINYL